MHESDRLKSDPIEEPVHGRRNARLAVPKGYTLHEPFQDFWPNVVLYIAIAVSVFPVVIYFYKLSQHPNPGEVFAEGFVGILIALTAIVALLYFFSLILITLVASFTALAVNFVFLTLNMDCENTFSGAFTGGLVGLIASLSVCFFPQNSYTFITFAICTATFLGQLGGYCGANICLRYREACGEPFATFPDRIQFGVRQLMVFTFWCAILLALLKWANLFQLRLLVVAGIWIVAQCLGLLSLSLLPSIKSHDLASNVSRETVS